MSTSGIQRLGIGGAFLGAEDDEKCITMIRRGIELGIPYLDTSPMYAGRRSQEIIGKALQGIDTPITLATKLGYLPSRHQHRSAETLRSQLADNLRQLQRESVDVLQIHEADLAHWWSDDASEKGRIDPSRQYHFASAPVMQVLREAKDRGLCRKIGITGNAAVPMTRLLGSLDLDTLLLAFNYDLLHRDARKEAVPLAKKKGVTMLVGGILQCGNLATVHREWLDAPPDWMTPNIREQYARLYALQSASGLSLVELTIRFLLKDERLDRIIVGAKTPQEIEHAAEAASRGPLDSDLHTQIEALA